MSLSLRLLNNLLFNCFSLNLSFIFLNLYLSLTLSLLLSWSLTIFFVYFLLTQSVSLFFSSFLVSLSFTMSSSFLNFKTFCFRHLQIFLMFSLYLYIFSSLPSVLWLFSPFLFLFLFLVLFILFSLFHFFCSVHYLLSPWTV